MNNVTAVACNYSKWYEHVWILFFLFFADIDKYANKR